MLLNYFKIAFRNLLRHKAFSFINIFGLALGMSACLLILQYVSFELSYDQFHQNKSHIYRVRNDKYKNGEAIQRGVVSYPVVSVAMKKDYPEILDYVRIAPWIADHTILKYGDKAYREKGLLFAEPAFFRWFSFPMLRGNAATALASPQSIVLSESKAREIFGEEDPMGKIITFEVNKPFTVTGIFKDVPPNSHIQFTMLVSYSTLVNWMEGYGNSWTFDEEVYAYLLLAPGTDVAKLHAKLADFSKRYYQGSKVSGTDEVFILQPLTDIHLHSHLQYELGQNGNASATWGLLAVAMLIMVIAWANYINLSTARYTERAKEIGVRKIVGATRNQLLTQFMVESLLVSLVSFFIAIVLFQWLNPFFLRQLNLPHLALPSSRFFGLASWVSVLALFIAGAIVSGIYPALILPSFKLVSILKGKLSTPFLAVSFRKILVVYQFVITIILLAFTWVVYQQVNFMTKQDLGVNIDGTLVVWGPMGLEYNDTFEQRMLSFEEEVRKLPQVKEISNSRNVPGDQLGKTPSVKLKGSQDNYTLASTWVGRGFFDLYGMRVLAGRGFSVKRPNLKIVILNQSAVKLLGFQQVEEAIGKKLQFDGQEAEIVGVVSDHHQQSLHTLVEPIMYRNGTGQDGYFSIKVSDENRQEAIAQVNSLYKDFFKGASFQYFFLEEYFDQQYRTEHLLVPVIWAFSFFAIFISCLGLWGLVLHAFAIRTKEIGIRKILGASSNQLVALLSKDFLQLVLIAFVIATPIGWYITHRWLQDFAYRIETGWWVFVLAGATALLIALLTVSLQAVKAALANPVESLRTE
ncbi:MAG: ABC transporter permease [Bacteroidota bacterium]